jgi:uncharacterized protein
MTIRHAGLALVVIAAAGAASAGKAQILEGPRERFGDTSTLRIAPLTSQGSVQTVIDLVNARGAHAAILPSDVLPYLRDGRLPGAASSLGYIKKLDQEEVHILARQEIINIADLAGKKVNFDLPDSRAFITGSVLFRALKINVQPVSLDQPRAIQQLRRGEIAAILYVAKSPARLFFDLNRDDSVHFLPVPFTEEVSRTYLPARLAPADYPLLIGGGEAGRGAPVTTIAVPIVLAVNSRTPAEASPDISRLIDAASSRATEQGSSSTLIPKADLAMEVPGWRRFVPTANRLEATSQTAPHGAQHNAEVARQSSYPTQQRLSEEPRKRDEQQLNGQAKSGTSTADTAANRSDIARQREALLREFLRWREQFSLPQGQPPQAAEDAFDEFIRSLRRQ